jgi:uncharacterized membrane protein
MDPSPPQPPPQSLPPPPPPVATPPATVSDTPAKVVYVLYLLSLVTLHLTSLIAVIVAYVYQGDAPEALRTHYRFQIRTFWIGLLYFIVSLILVPLFGVGALGFLLVTIWVIVRCVKGLMWMDRTQPVPNPATWWW